MSVSQSLDFRGLAETVGFYLIFVPSTFLLRVAATINAAVTAQVPASVPVIGGKCAKVRHTTGCCSFTVVFE